MDTRLVKTTIELEASIIYQAKMKALKEGKTLRQVISESLEKDLYGIKPKDTKRKIPKIGGFKLGGVRGDLRRVDIYENF